MKHNMGRWIMSLSEIWGRAERIKELERQTPQVVLRRRERGHRGYLYTDTCLGKVQPFESDGRKSVVLSGNGWTFRPGMVRFSTPELCQEIERIDAEIKTLQEQRMKVLKDRFMRLQPVSFEELLKTKQDIEEAIQKLQLPE